jgi:mono/diheme cytochrome c family protein
MVTIECGKGAEMKILAIIGGLVLVALVGGSIFIYSGIYNVAATIPHSSLMEWLLSTISDRSVIHQAEGISPPAYLNDPEIIKAGFIKYQTDCAGCHGSPISYPGKIGKGLNPAPPKLWESAEELSVDEMYWVIKNGIKMTGMPYWSHEYTDKDIWSVVAFLKQLPNISAQQYRQMTQTAKQ